MGRVTNKTQEWRDFREFYRKPLISRESHAEYLSSKKAEQDRLKLLNGYRLGGFCKDGKRRKSAIRTRSYLSLDLDTMSPDLLLDLEENLNDICKYEWIAHTTRKHTAKKPRLRILIPMTKPVPAEFYPAVARIVASKIDASMNAIDDVSFRVAQMMYNPTASKDSEYLYLWNEGEILDWDDILDEFEDNVGDWKDYKQLPYSKEQGQKRLAAEKAENPLSKEGPVGAFCRAYGIEEAIATFIPHVYEPSTNDSSLVRYTYVAGSNVDGVVVHDDDKFIYSHHGTDPCGDRLCNAFDMVRIHLFGEEDDTVDADTAPGKLPSYKAMVAFAGQDAKVKRELAQRQYDMAAMFDDYSLPGDAPAPPSPQINGDPLDRWFQDVSQDDDVLGPSVARAELLTPIEPIADWFPGMLDLTDDGVIRPTVHNVACIVQNDPRFFGMIAQNDFTGQVVARRSLVSKSRIVPSIFVQDEVNGERWEGRHDISIRAIIEGPNGKDKVGYGVKITDRDLEGGILLASIQHRFHPIQNFFEAVAKLWDGKPRVERIAHEYLGCPDTPYHRQVVRLMLLAAVTRVFEPGHKFDSALILEGKQGIGKSTFIRTLAMGRWFSELQGDVSDSRMMVEQMMGYLILELPELTALTRSDVNATKQFLSRMEDNVRLAYARRTTTWRRQCVFIGSTNDTQYLRDESGGRRFWPVKVLVQQIDTVRLRDEMPQIWGELVHAYREMRRVKPTGDLPLFLDDAGAREEALFYQEGARVESADEGVAGEIEAWLDEPIPLSKLVAPDRHFEDESGAPDIMVRRTRFCLKQLWTDCLGGQADRFDQKASTALSRSAGFLDCWTMTPDRQAYDKLGRQRWRYRDGATAAERRQGWQPVRDDLDDV